MAFGRRRLQAVFFILLLLSLVCWGCWFLCWYFPSRFCAVTLPHRKTCSKAEARIWFPRHAFRQSGFSSPASTPIGWRSRGLCAFVRRPVAGWIIHLDSDQQGVLIWLSIDNASAYIQTAPKRSNRQSVI